MSADPSAISARLDRLPWSRWHWRVVLEQVAPPLGAAPERGASDASHA